MAVTREDLEDVLAHEDIHDFMWLREDEVTFSRNCEFFVRGGRYEVEWYVNVSYLYVGELQIRFDDLVITGTWPNNFKNNIHFISCGEIVAILPITEY